MAFHTPNCKLVSKSYGRLMYNDFLHSADDETRAAVPAELRQLSYGASLDSKDLEKLFVALSKDRFESRVEPCIAAPTLCGNMYTASLYCSLISLISNVDPKEAIGKTIGMFSVSIREIWVPSFVFNADNFCSTEVESPAASSPSR